MQIAVAHLPKTSCTDAGGVADKLISDNSDCNIWQFLCGASVAFST